MSDPFDKARRHPRLRLQVPVRLSTIDAEKDPRTGRRYFRSSHEVCANLSRGGAFVVTQDPPAPGRRLLVEIHVPNREPIATIGRVAWSKRIVGAPSEADESGVGIEFIGAPASLAALDQLLTNEE